jgi:hypothetical protein
MLDKLTREEFGKETERITKGMNELISLNKYHAGCAMVSMMTLCAQQHIMRGGGFDSFMDVTNKIFSLVKNMAEQGLFYEVNRSE